MDTNIDAATFPTESLPATGLVTSTEPSDNHQEPSNPPPETTANSVEKRKRDDEEGEGEVDKSSAQHPFYKTSLCAFYRRQKKGECSHGETCRFAHSESELRPKPDGSWDPTSERGKKKIKLEREEKEAAEEEDELREAENAFMMPEALGEKDPKLSRCLIHLPRNWKSDRLKEFLTEQSVVFQSATKRKGMSVGFLSFETEEQVESATEVLHGKLLNNRNLKVANTRWKDHTKPSATESVLGDGGDPSTSLIDGENGETIDETRLRAKSVRDVVTPLAYLPYPEQLEQKKNALMQSLKKLTRNVRKSCPNGVPLPEWILKSREIGALPCRLEGIIESPNINGYRNKCEFTPGYSADGKITVGFLLGNFKEGVTTVQEPVDCPNISEIACKYASIFQEFLQGSTLPVWNRFGNKGFWRQLTVREGRNPEKISVSEVLLMVQVCSTDADSAVVDDELKKMTQAFSTGAASNSPPLTFLVVQDHTGISNVAPADAPLRQLLLSAENIDSAEGLANINALNESRIHDYISDLKFSISPTAFFQVNTMAAEKLYSLTGDWAGLGPDTLLFDICCGTGTIGLMLAHRVGLVVGIEMNSSAVSDAQRNAEINGIKNCRFVCSKAENVIDSLLKEYLKVTKEKEQDTTSYSPKVENKENIEENGKDTAADKETAQGDDENPESETHTSNAAEHVEEDQQNQHEKISTENGIQENKQFSNVVVIVDPPRMGLHPVVTKTLRSHPSLCRLVYISCNPDTLVANAIELCTPSSENGDKKGHGNLGWRKMSNAGLARYRAKSMPNSEPFKPVKAMAVDMFPHTPHCELVMLLER